ncbi:hypothetical protein LCGC14_1157100 [marine sediment metagenome]|uniref:Uncharacterized protein n=1 Tax=marine sediment metagenome TaxID=412755 RepID=A0A0F9PC08_9ZZZZ
MSKPSKLKRAIRKMEEKIEGYILEKIRIDGLINAVSFTIEMLKKIENGGKDGKQDGTD